MKTWVGSILTVYIFVLGALVPFPMALAQGGNEVSVYSLGTESDLGFEKARGALVEAFIDAYSKGETDIFLRLFSDNARADDKIGKSGIRSDYEMLFTGSRSRIIRLQNIKWHNKKGDDSYAIADFEARVIPNDKDQEKIYRGAIELHVKKENNNIVISELYHAYDNASVATQ